MGKTFLVQSEFEATRFYKVTLDDKSKKLDTCNCGGVIQYMGDKRYGKPQYRRKNNCFHIEWARDHRTVDSEVLYSGGVL